MTRVRAAPASVLRRALLGATILVAVLQTSNNLLPYIGLRDDSCQTMFSGLAWKERTNNHHFMPQRMVGDLWVFYGDLEVELEPEPTGRRLEAIAAWLRRDGVRHNAEAVRVAVRQLCDAGHAVRLDYVADPDRPRVRSADACADPRLSEPHAWIPVRLFDSDYPPF